MNAIEKQRAPWRALLPGVAEQVDRAVESNEKQPEDMRRNHAAEAVGTLLGCGIYLRAQSGPGPDAATLTIRTGQASGDNDQELVIEARQPAGKACEWNARINGPATSGAEPEQQRRRHDGARDTIDEATATAVARLARAAIRMAVPPTAWRAWIATLHFAGVAEALECRARTQRAIGIVDYWQRDGANQIRTLTAALAEARCGLRIRHNEAGPINGIALTVPRTTLGQLRDAEHNQIVSDRATPVALIGIRVYNHGIPLTIEAEGEGRTLLGMLQDDEGRTTTRNKLRAALSAVAWHPDVATRQALDRARARGTRGVLTIGETWLQDK